MLISRDRGLTPEPPSGFVQQWGSAVVSPRSAGHLRAVVTGTIASMTGEEQGATGTAPS